MIIHLERFYAIPGTWLQEVFGDMVTFETALVVTFEEMQLSGVLYRLYTMMASSVKTPSWYIINMPRFFALVNSLDWTVLPVTCRDALLAYWQKEVQGVSE